ncbi:MAG: hypothetical protein H6841_09895, partial [Planctomycetes bacterium]|nr:hypothetical protein [Planctomycetota bacterium]
RIVVHCGEQQAEYKTQCTLNKAIEGYQPVWRRAGHSVMVVGRQSSVWMQLQQQELVGASFRPVDVAQFPQGTEPGHWTGLLQVAGTPKIEGKHHIEFDTEYYFHAGRGTQQVSRRRPHRVAFDVNVVNPGESLLPYVGQHNLFLLVGDDYVDLNMWAEGVRPEVEGALKAIPEQGTFNLATVTWRGLKYVFESAVAPDAVNCAAALDAVNESEFAPKESYSKSNMMPRFEKMLPKEVEGFTNVVLICPSNDLTDYMMKYLKGIMQEHARAWKPAKLIMVVCGPIPFDAPQAELVEVLEAEGAEVFFLP